MFHELMNARLHAVDGEIGSIIECYFDTITWQIRYLLVKTDFGSDGHNVRTVLISPVAIGAIENDVQHINIELTRREILDSPAMDWQQPISRDYEQAYVDYYQWPGYWEDDPRLQVGNVLHRSADIQGADVEARDGTLGTVRDFLLDLQYWSIRYLDIEVED